MKGKYYLLIFCGVCMSLSAPKSSAQPQPDGSNEPAILAPIREILPRFLAALTSGYEKETLIAKGELKTRNKEYLVGTLDSDPCRLKRRELMALLSPGRSVSRKISFTESCPMDGQVRLVGDDFRSLDLTLKDLAPYYRFQAKLRLRKTSTSTDRLIGVELTIADGKLYRAQQPYLPDAEFSGQYKLVLDANGKLVSEGNGDLYIKTENQKSVDRLIPFVLKRAEIP